ncbi:50S ribosomal protein L25 [Terrilactibacillus laevilacticus]|uniref:Large ribosomal subunit protein bL25 n=1 Tax=Terrilactibacillus laevilacticus TaxID=1380157 RepID=A0ABW5PRE3_9BACI|nr:50S ribosomal protein L25 [Terrilactibacillus laevilacticus]
MVLLNAIERDHSKKSIIKDLRRHKKIPGVVYGKNVMNQSIAVDESDILKAFRSEGRNAIFQLKLEGNKETPVMVHEIQFDPLTSMITHLDFLKVDMNTEVEAVVPVVLNGEASGGGVVQLTESELNVRALPNNIPSVIEINITGLTPGDHIKIGDLKTSRNYRFVGHTDEIVVSVSHVDQVEEEEATESQDTETSAPIEA